jgi:uncharacterized protein YjbI with pentapeptide repeats
MLNDLTTRMNRRAGLAAMLALLGVGIEEVDATKQAKRRRRRKGVNNHQDFSRCTDFRPGADLSGCNLTGANLAGARLHHANLTDANLTDANLTRADMYSTILWRADLTGANLSAAHFCQTTMPDGTTNNANC